MYPVLGAPGVCEVVDDGVAVGGSMKLIAFSLALVAANDNVFQLMMLQELVL